MPFLSYWQVLRRLTPMELATTLFGLSGLLLIIAAVDVVFRHLLGLPKDVAFYLSVLSVALALTILVQCRWITARTSSSQHDQIDSEES
jgi:hypothetical protein